MVTTLSHNRTGRKKQRVPGEWVQNKSKIIINMGAEYVGISGKVVLARKSDVDCECSMRCFEHINEQYRQLVFNKFWALADYNIQNGYLFGQVESKEHSRQYRNRQSVAGQLRQTTMWKYIQCSGCWEQSHSVS